MSTATHAGPTRSRGLLITLWVAQILLAIAFSASGFMKLVQPIDALAIAMGWPGDVPPGLVRFIGAAELAGALGLILPSVTRIRPRLTVLAALGLVIVMVLAAGFHVTRGEGATIAPNVVLGLLAAFVAWGRGKAAPIAPRA